jgi:predicted secreted protein
VKVGKSADPFIHERFAMSEEHNVQVVQAGQKFTIDLEAIPGAGYMWEMTQHPEAVEIVDQKVVSISKEIGGSSTQRFFMVAHQPGNYSVVFELKRRWEKSSVKSNVFYIQAT